MKKIKYIHIVLIAILLIGSCKQEPIIPTDPAVPTPLTPSKGSADFTKFVSVGNSYVAGMQAYSLFTESQANSIPSIMAKQFVSVGGSSTFNQPDISSVNGFNPVLSVFASPTDQVPAYTLGRMILYDPDGSGPRSAAPSPAHFPGAAAVTCPSAVPATPALPAPYNTADYPTDFTGLKSALNNFGVPLVYTQQFYVDATSGPAVAKNLNPAYSVFFSRFCTAKSPSGAQGSGSTIIGDAKAAAGSFYMIWMGFDDVLLYAATGADGVSTGTFPMTASGTFATNYNTALGLLTTGNSFKGVVGNIPDFTSLPYFYTVPWNTISLDAATASTLTTNLANNYNAILDAAVSASVITASERDKRKLAYKAGSNGVLLTDEDLTDLTAFMNGAGASALVPYAKARQASSTDLIPLAAGSILGTCNGGNPNAVWGVSYPVTDQYALTAAETTSILSTTAAYNSAITAAVATVNGSSTRLVIADVRKALNDFVTAKAIVSNGVTITPSFAPPTGAWSEDGLHFNNRGNAFAANVFINAINTGFSAVIPNASLASYTGTKLPVTP